MGTKIAVQWTGKGELESVLKKALFESEKAVSASLKNHAELMKVSAKAHAPVDTGALKENITASYQGKLSAEIRSGVGYAGFQEFGTRYQGGTPHIRPAFNEIIPKFESQLREIAEGLFV